MRLLVIHMTYRYGRIHYSQQPPFQGAVPYRPSQADTDCHTLDARSSECLGWLNC